METIVVVDSTENKSLAQTTLKQQDKNHKTSPVLVSNHNVSLLFICKMLPIKLPFQIMVNKSVPIDAWREIQDMKIACSCNTIFNYELLLIRFLYELLLKGWIPVKTLWTNRVMPTTWLHIYYLVEFQQNIVWNELANLRMSTFF